MDISSSVDSHPASRATLTVDQAADRAGISAAAVRAQLRKGTGPLTGRQVERGERLVWEVDSASVTSYLASGSSSPRPAQARSTVAAAPVQPTDRGTVHTLTAAAATTPPTSRHDGSAAPHTPSEPVHRSTPMAEDPVALRAEVVRLRRQVEALRHAHKALLDALD